MDRLIKTLENKTAVIYTAVCFMLIVLSAITGFLIARYENNSAKIQAVQYQLATAGRLSQSTNLTDSEIADIVLSETTQENITAGEEILGNYGVSNGSPIGGEYVYRGSYISFAVGIVCGMLYFTVGIFTLCKVYGKLREITRQTENTSLSDNPKDDRDIFLLKESIINLMSRTSHLLEKNKADKEYLINYLQDFSHQIKTPCTGLILNNDILRHTPLPFDEQKQFFDADKSCLNRIERLCTGALKLARLDAGAVDYTLSECNIEKICREICYELKPIADKNNDKITVNISHDITLSCDEIWFSEAVSNLVKNAVEHTADGNVKIYAVSIPTELNIYIEDNGNGIAPEDIPYVFRRFYSKSAETNPSSAGIGMSVSKKIIEDMNGKIYIDSEKNKGTTVRLQFLV